MNYEIIKELEKEQLKDNAPAFNVGDTVRVHNRIKEGNRERVQIFEGTVLKIQGGGPRTTLLQSARNPAASVLRRHGLCTAPTLRRWMWSDVVRSEERNSPTSAT